jgi:hypothetical protein
VFAAISAVMLQAWRWERDAFAKRIDEFCTLILDAADLAATFWTVSKPLVRPILGKESDPAISKDLIELQKVQTRVEGYQRKIDLFRIMIQDKIRITDRDQIVDRSADFFDAMTGGNFDAPIRTSDPRRARLVYMHSADFIAQLRRTPPRPSLYFVLFWLAIFLAIVFVSWRFFKG